MNTNPVIQDDPHAALPPEEGGQDHEYNNQPDSQPDFSSLLQAVGQKRDRTAFIALFNHFAPRLKSFLIRQGSTIEQAEELVQETMLTVWSRAASFNPERAAAGTWIFTIARNKRIDALRRKKRANDHIRHPKDHLGHPHTQFRAEYAENDPAFIPDPTTASPDQAVIRTDRNEKLAAALHTLPPEQEAIIRKAFYEGKTHNEIAGEDKIPLGTVKSRLRLAMDKLHHHLGQSGKELL